MNNAFSAELYKLKLNGEFFGCLIFVALSVGLGLLDHEITTASESIHHFTSLLPMFLAISVSNIACSDYTKNTLKNIVSSGNSRFTIYSGKLLASVVTCILYSVIDCIAVLIVSTIKNGVGDIEPIKWVESIVLQLVVMIIYTLIFFGISSFFKSTKRAYIYCVAFGFILLPLIAFVGKPFGKDTTAFTLNSLSSNIYHLKLNLTTFIDIVIYLVLGVAINFIAYKLFKNKDI